MFCQTFTLVRWLLMVQVRQQPQLSRRQFYSSRRQVQEELRRSAFMPVMWFMREDQWEVGLRILRSLQSLRRQVSSRVMPSRIWLSNMSGSTLEQMSTMLFSIFLILGFIWLLMVFLSSQFMPKMFSSCFCRISCRDTHFASKLSMRSYIFQLLRSSLSFLSIHTRISSFRNVSVLLVEMVLSTGSSLIFDANFKLISYICSLLSLTSLLSASSWKITSLTNLELEFQLPRLTLMLEFNPWKEFFRSTPQSPQALDFLVPVKVPIQFTKVSNFSSFSLLKSWKLLANLVKDSCRWLVSSLRLQKFSSFFLRAVLICVTSSSKALSYLAPCSFITSDTFSQISSFMLSISRQTNRSTFSWLLTSDPLNRSSLLSLSKKVLLDATLGLLPEYPTTSSISTGISFLIFLSQFANTPLCISRLVLQFLEAQGKQAQPLRPPQLQFSLGLLVLGWPLEFI